MSRSILLPVFALMGIVLYGTTRAARPAADLPDPSGTRVEIADPSPEGPSYQAPPPPPAPRLRSEIEAEAAREDSLDALRAAAEDADVGAPADDF